MMVEGGCPKCGSLAVFGSFKADDLYEKCGSKLVRKRGVKYLVFNWVCEACGYKWSALECVKGVPFRSMSAEKCPICRSNLEREM